MRTTACALLLLLTGIAPLQSGCEQQDAPVRAAEPPVTAPPSRGERVSSPGMPGTTGYYNALSGAKGVAENTKDKVDDYNRKLEDEMDDLFND
ncbi:MAG: hypothetical protein VX641_01515 [Planctomycetota bacterium]|nr:hypothetical protein [Planctomycetota bacterium]